MSRLAGLAICVVALAAPGTTAAANPPVTSALPHGAHIAQILRLHGTSRAWVSSYRYHGWWLGVIDSGANPPRLLWRLRLSGPPGSLSVPGHSGLFRVVAGSAPSQSATLYAFRVANHRVHSAIAGSDTGAIAANEGATLTADGFTVQAFDDQHQGAVRYRFEIHYQWQNALYRYTTTQHVPDYDPAGYPRPNGMVHTQNGDIVLVRLEVASTTTEKTLGLMYRESLDPDSGMIFVWDQEAIRPFWMENTYIPLSIAFLAPDGTIQEIQDMQPLTTNYHMPAKEYQDAIEVNQGFFSRNGIVVGDRFQLDLSSAASRP